MNSRSLLRMFSTDLAIDLGTARDMLGRTPAVVFARATGVVNTKYYK